MHACRRRLNLGDCHVGIRVAGRGRGRCRNAKMTNGGVAGRELYADVVGD